MLAIYWLKSFFEEIWWDDVTGCIKLLECILLSIGTIIISILILIFDLLISPIELATVVIWEIRKLFEKLKRNKKEV